MNEQPKNSFHENILRKITSGEVTMHSKMYFVWRTVVVTLAICLVCAALVFLVSFVLFILQVSRLEDLPQFGLHGLREFLEYFPWLFIPALALFLWLAERFMRQYSFAYRIPILYLGLCLLVLVGALSVAILATPFHDRLYESAREQRLPFFGPMYRFFGGSRPDDFFVGRLISLKGYTYVLEMTDGQSVTVVATAHTHIDRTYPIGPGEVIEVVGEEKGCCVDAYDIRGIPPPYFMENKP